MTVSSSYTDKVYQINGSTTTFAWGQDLDTQYGSLVVTEETAASGGTVVTTYVEGTDYEVINKDVVFNTAPSDTTHYIHIARNTYKGQPVQFIEGEDFPAEDYEHSLDRLAMIAQEQAKGLADETSARIATDTAEATARGNADTTLDNKITAETTRATGVEGSLSNLTTTAKTNLVSAINEVDSDVGTINTTLGTYGNIVTHNTSEFATASQGAKADTAVQPASLATVATSGSYNDLSNKPSIPAAQIQSDWSQSNNTKLDYIKNKPNLATVATSGSYNDLSNKPTIPTVNNATLTLTQGGTTKGTFTANASSDTTIELDAGGSSGGELISIKGGSVTWNNTSVSTTLISVSNYVSDDRDYFAIVEFDGASKLDLISSKCAYSNKAISVEYHVIPATYTAHINSITLIPVTDKQEYGEGQAIIGITNGKYQSTQPYYTKSEADTLLSGKQATLTAGTGIDITSNVISTTGEDIVVFDEFSFTETPSSPDVSEALFNKITLSDNRVVDGRQYFPMFISNGNNMPYLSNYISYRKSDKRISIVTNHIAGHTRSFTGTLVLIPCNSDTLGNSQVGYCNGLYDETSSKTIVTDNQISDMLTTSDIATSVDSSSTNDKTVGAKLFYDTCGDIETLINAL